MNNRLPMPENIPLRWELIRGFGIIELRRSAIITAIVLGLCILFCTISASQHSQIISVVAVILTIFLCVCFFTRADGNKSIYDYIRLSQRYHAEQQKFYYVTELEAIESVEEEQGQP